MKIATIVRLIVSLVLVLTVAGCVQVPVSGQWDFGTRKATIYGDNVVGQDFYVSDRNLNRIDIFLYPSRIIKPTEEGKIPRQAWRELNSEYLTINLYSLPEKERLITSKLSVGRIREARMYTFPFEPIASSKQKRFYLELKAPSLTSRSAVAVRMTDLDRYKGGTAFIEGQSRADADIGFQTYIQMTSIVLIHSIVSRLASDPLFMVVWGLAVLFVFSAAMIAWRRDRLVS